MPLKFLIRTSDMSYPIIHGQYHHHGDQKHVPTSLLQHRYFTIQVNSDNGRNSSIGISSNDFYGCCDHEHNRIILVREMNFVHYCSDWDLYVTAERTTTTTTTTTNHNPSYHLLPLILVPYTLHRNECQEFKNWTYIGTCRASAIRLDVEAFVLKHLQSLNNHPVLDPQRYSYPIGRTTFQNTDIYNIQTATTSSNYHWHIDVYMDSMIDESYASVSISTCIAPLSVSISPDQRTTPPIIDAANACDLASTCDKENHINHTNHVVELNAAMRDTTALLPPPQRKRARRKKLHRLPTLNGNM
jgi:hypothetical protein